MNIAMYDDRLTRNADRIERFVDRIRESVSTVATTLWLLQLVHETYVQRYINYRIEPTIKKSARVPLDEDFMRKRARGYGKLAVSWNLTCDKWEQSSLVSCDSLVIRFLYTVVRRNMEITACWFEDVAELFALAASREFWSTVEEDVRSVSTDSSLT